MGLTRTSIEQWAVLAAVVDHGGFAQAARALHRSQSAVSYALARLQAALDVPLLSIQGRKAVLTPHGETLLKRARPLVRDLETLEALSRSLKQGWEPQLNVTVDAAFPRARLLAIVAELQRMCPQTQLQFSDAVLSGAEEAITGGGADLVITTRVPDGFLGEFLFHVSFVAVAAPAHPLFGLDRVLTAEDLTREVQAVIRDSGTRHRRDEGWLGAERRCTVSSMEASLAIVQAGLAYAWLPEHLVQEPLQRGMLRRLPLALGGARSVPLSLVVVRPEVAGPAARAAVECFQRHVPASASPHA
ncbi:MAG TPA: LysR family transcriptional regulator [Steroidobacteraceae bacterium]|nr:LysR family transcriptional regulator [Steroidobacteraceae bacterium]